MSYILVKYGDKSFAEPNNEEYRAAMLYGVVLSNYKASNFGGVLFNDKPVERYFNADGEVCIKIDGKEIVVYKIVASTFLEQHPPEWYKNKHVHHNDNNSLNFSPVNLRFVTPSKHAQLHEFRDLKNICVPKN